MSVISIGTFDGIHLGHRKLLQTMLDIGKAEHIPALIISFQDHPSFVINQNRAVSGLLCPANLKVQVLKELGFSQVELLDFTPALASMTALDFLKQRIIAPYKPRYIVVGYDSHFGKGREGNRSFLEAHAAEYGYKVIYVEPLMDNGAPVSSSRIRQSLALGDIQEANRLLGRPYRLCGSVTQGISQGRKLGFPTANLALSNPHQLIPKEGIYFSRVHLKDAVLFGLTNIGKSPTVKSAGITEIESFLIDFKGNLYGKEIQVELLKYLREEKMFANTEKLQAAMQEDLRKARLLIREQEG